MGVLQEFKAFAVKGNVVDMAVGIVIGTAFGKIISSIVEDVIMPPIGLLIGGVNFSDLAFTLQEASEGTAAVAIKYGKFLQTIIDFTIIAFAIFMVVNAINRLKKKESTTPPVPSVPPPPSAEERLLTDIRDLLKSKQQA